MKRILFLALTAILALSLFGVSAAPAAPTGPVQLVFATQEVGTAAYNYAAAIQAVFLETLPEGSSIDLSTTSPGGVGAPIVLENAQCDIIMSNAGPAKWSYETGILDKPATPSVRAIAGGLGHDFVNVLFTQAFVDKTGITTVEELVEQKHPVRIAIKQNGTLGALAAEKVLGALGVTFEDVNGWGGNVTQTGSDAIKSLLQDSMADMTIDHVGAGQANTTELCMTTDMFFPQLADSTLEKLAADGFEYIEVEADTWNGQTEVIKSVGSQQVVLVHADMEDSVAYLLTKALAEGQPELEKSIAVFSHFDPTRGGIPGNAGAPVHPGAAAYYAEIGYPVD